MYGYTTSWLPSSMPVQVVPTNNVNDHNQMTHVSQSGQHVMYQNVQPTGGNNSGNSSGNGIVVDTQMLHQMVGHHTSSSHKKQKRPKVNKDGVPAPKRATTAYINYTQWYREELKKKGLPVPKVGDFGKECAGKWNAMTEEEKQPFVTEAEKDRDRYRREMAIYKPAREAGKPKRPGTAFMLYMGDLRKEMAGKEPEGGVAALAKLGGERWRGMSDEDKRPYVEMQNEEKIRYEQLMEDFRRNSNANLTSTNVPVKTSSDHGSGVESDTASQDHEGGSASGGLSIEQKMASGSSPSPSADQSAASSFHGSSDYGQYQDYHIKSESANYMQESTGQYTQSQTFQQQ